MSSEIRTSEVYSQLATQRRTMSAPELLDHVLGIDDVSEGFAHFPAFAVENEAMGQDRSVGGLSRDGDASRKAGVEPTAVLVGAL